MSRPLIRPCPFCGGTNVEILDYPDGYVAACEGCEAHGPGGAPTETEAWKKWDSRR